MKKIITIIMCLMMMGTFIGCNDETTDGGNADVNYNNFEADGTIQGTIYNAVTGARIGDDSLTMTLVKGKSYKSPALLENDSTEATVGDYVFTKVPVTIDGNAIYRIVASMTGYQTFEGYVNLTTTGNNAGVSDEYDTVYNFIGNIYMFPTGSTASDQSIYVEYDGERVEGATVLVEYQPNNANATTATSIAVGGTATLFPVAVGLNTSLSGTTDANGLVTFAGTSLVLGGTYSVTVYPLVYEGVQLARTAGTALNVGLSTVANDIVVAMTDEEPGVQSEGLFVTYASNRDADDVLATGVLTFVFNRPVALVNETGIGAVMANDVTATLDATATGSDVTAAVSADGYTLTITPVFTTAPVATEYGLTITYSSVFVTTGDDTYDAVNVITELVYANGTAISALNGGTVNIIAQQN